MMGDVGTASQLLRPPSRPTMIQMLVSKMSASSRESKRASCVFPNMNSGLDVQLREIERQLHLVIQNCSNLSSENNNNNNVDSSSRESIISSKSVNSIDSLDILKPDPSNFSLSSLKLRMRLVRRWRNGSRVCTAEEVNELASFLIDARLRTLSLQLDQLRKDLDDMDSVVIHTGADDVARTMRLQLEVDVNGFQDALEIVQEDKHEVDEESLVTLEEQMANMAESFRALKCRIKSKEIESNHMPSGRAELHRGQSFERRRSKVRRKSFKTLTKIEEHPLVNQVLRCEGRIRRMIHSLRGGGHVEIAVEKEAVTSGADQQKECSENDIEVLERQLLRLRRWQKMNEEFKKDDVNDVEQVVSAIERHIRSTVDLDLPLGVVKQEKLFIKKQNSVPHESVGSVINGHDTPDSQTPEVVTNGHSGQTDIDDDLLNERLI